ncbi:MAG TPA: hypothetical protein VGE72_04465, partial [Azospirillum sp.]
MAFIRGTRLGEVRWGGKERTMAGPNVDEASARDAVMAAALAAMGDVAYAWDLASDSVLWSGAA